ncbi:MAG: DDE-type integrase/transposase/recombinase [Polynucleobacter sp.]|uniref:Mu transposase C-terminal domain-containing protein n=1 Tax=Polynucleobacter sp. TaxID=2029855 RepID=UPI002727801C|nr:Mu transposase C-terminal domain-containing protein [Polynucleobacter sp.]MDO8714343.1 DDE-type integrase/transposase/recombinase [Polynucleobacter sp.]
MKSVSVQLSPGSHVRHQGRSYQIKHVIDLNEVVLLDKDSGKVLHAKITDLEPAAGLEPIQKPDLMDIPEKDWEEAQRRYGIIFPLLEMQGRTREDVAKRAHDFELHPNTLYGWMRAYEESGLVSSLVKQGRSDKGSSRIDPTIEEIIKAVVKEEYLTKQKKSAKKVCIEVERRCRHAKITAPHSNTIRNRLKQLSDEYVISKRLGKKVASNLYDPIEGEFPGATYPLAVIQIDHTPIDIILVDDIHRQSIRRPWLTLAIDVFSRMVAGFYISFDPPGALASGQCLANAILPKDNWLMKHNIKGEWPLWGKPSKIHMDNAKEFRGKVIIKACEQHGIDIDWRPVANPNFGGNIERLLGTFAREIHALPGTTFANTKQRGDYDSENSAVFTLTEFEEWLVTLITNVYHQRKHSSLGMSPIEKYQEGIFGDKDNPGRGLQNRIVDEHRLRLDFMPYEERTIQPYGVVIDDIHYYGDVLRPWINATDPNSPKYKRKFLFRRDPRDISVLWFYDPEVKDYYAIPYRNTSRPAISLWELRAANAQAKSEGRSNIDEEVIFEAYDRLREIEARAKSKTASVRRLAQRRNDHQNVVSQKLEPKSQPRHAEAPTATPDDDPILPFDEMDDLS